MTSLDSDPAVLELDPIVLELLEHAQSAHAAIHRLEHVQSTDPTLYEFLNGEKELQSHRRVLASTTAHLVRMGIPLPFTD